MRWFWQAAPQVDELAQKTAVPAVGPGDRQTESTENNPMEAFAPHIFALTDVGRVREHNEDAYHVSNDGNLFVVADGMGGHEAGEVAAALAIEAINEFLPPERLSLAVEQGDVGSLLLEAVRDADNRVFEANRSRDEGKEMGCTLAVGYVSGSELVTCHVGDVRCYVSVGGTLRQITRDHSFVGALVEAGQLTPDEARIHPRKNEVLQAIGMPSGVVPDVNRVDLATGDRILLCSDGLWEALADQDIQTILTSDGTVRQLATQLVDRANGAGGSDNITVVLFEVGSLPEHQAVASEDNVAQVDEEVEE